MPEPKSGLRNGDWEFVASSLKLRWGSGAPRPVPDVAVNSTEEHGVRHLAVWWFMTTATRTGTALQKVQLAQVGPATGLRIVRFRGPLGLSFVRGTLVPWSSGVQVFQHKNSL
jgi:hypothetical protein